MRQVLIRIPLDSPWSIGIILLLWIAMGAYWLYGNRTSLKERPSRLAVPGVIWLVIAGAIIAMPYLVHRSADRELQQAKIALASAEFGSESYREIHKDRDQAWRRRRLFSDAVAAYELEIKEHPGFAPAYYRLAWILATAPDDSVRDGKRALELAKTAVVLAENDRAIAAGVLAASYAEAGDFEEAVRVATTAARRSSRSAEVEEGEPGKLVPIRQRLQRYQSGKPYRDLHAGRSLPVYGYGFMMFLGFAAAGWTALHRGRLVGIDREAIWDVCLWVLVAGIGGARLFFVVQYRDRVFEGSETAGDYFFSLINLREGGLVLYGGIILGLTAFIVFCLRRKLSPLLMTDVITPSFFVGLAFGRLGCFMNGCCYGNRCELPWGVSFPLGSVPDMALVGRGFVDFADTVSMTLHPSQIYSSLNALMLAVLLHFYFTCRRRDGSVLALALLTYPVTRFLIEFLRGDEMGQLQTPLTISQLVSLGMLAFGGLYSFWLWRRPAVITPIRVSVFPKNDDSTTNPE